MGGGPWDETQRILSHPSPKMPQGPRLHLHGPWQAAVSFLSFFFSFFLLGNDGRKEVIGVVERGRT